MKYGCGEIEERDGKFRVRAYVEGKRKHLGTYATIVEAQRVLDGLAALHVRGEVAATGASLVSYGERWLDRREVKGARAIDADRSRWERHCVRAEFASWPMRDVGKRDVREWVDGLRKVKSARGKPLGAQTILHIFNLVSGCFTAAVEDEEVERNPCLGIKVDRPTVSPDMWTYLLPNEQRALATCEIKGAKDDRERELAVAERMIALVALGTGMRQGEQWNLELRDVHIDDANPWLYVRWGSKGKPPKNGRPRRVDLFGIGLAAMKAWLRRLPTYSPENPEALAFPTQRGARRGRSKVPRRWRLLLKSAGLVTVAKRHDRRPVRWHDLRHTCASSLVAGWWGRRWSLHEVQHVLGHRSIQVTERYSHLAESVITEAGAATAGLTVPGTVPGPDGATVASARILGARHAGFEPAAFGFGGPRGPEELRDVAAVWDRLGTIAERYLRALETRSRHVHRHGVELAEAVLAERARVRGEQAPVALGLVLVADGTAGGRS